MNAARLFASIGGSDAGAIAFVCLFVLIACACSGGFAAMKGYSFSAWFLGGGLLIVALPALLLLPDVSTIELADERDQARVKGNSHGVTVSVITVVTGIALGVGRFLVAGL